MIDFTPVRSQEQSMDEFAKRFTVADLRTATTESTDYLLGHLYDLQDRDVVFEAVDASSEDGLGWSIAHLVAHVTATSEEGAAFSSLLARGVPMGGRLRYETDWHTLTTQAQCVQRLEESRRMRLAYLETWPDQPHLDLYREIPPRLEELFGQINATGSFLLGLMHEVEHHAQFLEVKQQALAAH